MKKIDLHFLNIAEKAAQKSGMRHKLSAMVVFKRTILAVGYNRFLGAENDPVKTFQGAAYSIHAEIDAILKLRKVYPEMKYAAKSKLYVARNKSKLARPCDECMEAIMASGLFKEIYYTAGIGLPPEKVEI